MTVQTYPEFNTNYNLLLKTFMQRPVDIYPNEIGIVYRNPVTGQYLRLTWQEWYDRTGQLAKAMIGPLGIDPGKPGQPGDRVGTMALNHHRHMELYYAVPCCGAVLHPINIRLSLDHIVHTIRHAEDKILFVDDNFWPLLESIYDRIKDTVKQFVYLSDKPGLPQTKIEPLYEYETLIKEQSPGFEWPYFHEDTYATLCYTTGTTGLPKGAMFTHRQLYLQTLHDIAYYHFTTDPSIIHFGEAEVWMALTPLYHVHGWGAPFNNVFSANKLVLPGMFTVEGFCELVQTEKVTSTSVVPTILAMIVEYEDIHKYDLNSLKNLGVGGGALTLGLKRKAEKIIPGLKARSGYGMTETAPFAIRAFVKKTMIDWPEEKLDEIRVKTGLALPGLEVTVVDETGKPVPRDNETVGEILIRGPWIMGQYYHEPEKTAEAWRDGWFHTGDVAKVDEEGYATIADRKSDIIRSGAEMVPTVLMENLTALAEFVLEATYVGVPDEKWGQRPMAIVALVPGAKEKEKDIIDFLQTEGVEKGKITKWMLPDYILITKSIPKTSVGKFDKIAIKKQLPELLPKAKKTK
ncbi:MAG: long-chain-fatty-acid--CoA ligase [Thermodesulfobacteriota bacterium]|jgi:acyl-CoA synthetase (AMP-forming)/AMP-acid ligase II